MTTTRATTSSVSDVTAGVPQQRTLLAFLSQRAHDQVTRAYPRTYGPAADALARYATTSAPEPGLGEYPTSRSALAACERTYQMAPDEVRAVMLPVLEKFRAHVNG